MNSSSAPYFVIKLAVKDVSALTHSASFFLRQRTWVLGVLLYAASYGYAGSLSEKFAALPLRFEENRGQADSSVRFVARSAGYTALLSDASIDLQSKGPVRIAFQGGRAASINPAEPLVTRSNYFIGNDPARWRTNVPNFGRVRYSALYAGIDAAIYGDGRNLEYDFIVASGADPARICLVIEGRDKPVLDAEGNLQLSAGLVMHRPVVYQETAQGRRAVAAHYQLRGNEVRFQIGEYDPDLALVIDPVLSLSYSTLLGGNGDETAWGVAADSNGNAYIAGVTSSTNFPTFNPYQGSFGGGSSSGFNPPSDFFVAKFNSTGTALLYSTYLGGSGNETVSAGVVNTIGTSSMLAIDSTGNAYITGLTASLTDYPVTAANAYQPTLPQGSTASSVLSKLSPSGFLLYSTYFGGSFAASNAVAVDNSGNAYLAGSVSGSGTGFPTTPNAFVSAFTPSDFYEAFLAKINTNLAGANSLQYSTFFGRNAFGTAVAVDNSGGVYLAGNLPVFAFQGEGGIGTKNSLYLFPGGGGDAYLAKFDPTQSGGASLVYSTYFGGSGADILTDVATDSNGNVYIAGSTTSSNLPTTLGAYQQFPPIPQGSSLDLFVAKFNSTGTAASYVTYVGGSGADTLTAFAVDPSGNAVLTGSTNSSNFPQVNGFPLPASQPSTFTFVTKLNAAGSNLIYSSYFIDSGSVQAAATDLNGNVYLAGQAFQGGLDPFPVTLGAYQTQFAASSSLLSDAFLSMLVFTGSGPGAPAVTGVTPNRGGQLDKIVITIKGANFLAGAIPSLTSGATTITGTSVQIAPGGGSLSAVFDLRLNPLGTYDATVTNPDATSGTLPLAFSLQTSVITNVPTRAGFSGTVTVTVRSPQGGFEQNALIQLVQNTTVLTAGPTTVRPDGLSATGTFQFSNAPLGLYSILVNNPDGTFQSAPAAFNITTLFPASVTMTPVGTSVFGIGKYQTFAVDLCNSGDLDSSPRRLYVAFPSYEVIIPQGWSYNTIVNNGYTTPYIDVGPVPADQCIDITFVAFTPTSVAPHATFSYFLHMSQLAAGSGQLHPRSTWCTTDPSCPPPDAIPPPPPPDNDPPGGDDWSGHTDPRTPGDPNLKTGPAGGGSAAYIRPQTPLGYFVEFENEANASAPAQDVTVTDQLDPSLVDVTTLSFGNMGWGNQVISLPGGSSDFSTTVDLRPGQNLLVQLTAHFAPATNTITWTFHSIDPATGQSPNDPTVGFLPPNTSPPAGQGYVNFTVQQRPGLATGTAISNTASVIFNALAPIVTPAWVNTVDANLPSSSVSALPVTAASTTFPVSWSGTDVGSGIQGYSVYVSVNHGPFSLWQENTSATSASYSGAPNTSYGFYSIADDNAGNLEAAKTVAEASTVTPVGGGTPASMTANAGTTPQSATISTAFANPLAVTVKDAGSTAVSGVNVTFTAPGSGPSGIFSNSTTTITVATNASGVASAPFTANATADGTYNVTAASAGLTTLNFALTNTTGSATSMTANAGTTPQSATVSTAFANPLAVTVKDAGSNPVAGVNVTFTAPGSGASGLFSNSTTSIVVATNAAGVASAPFTANATSGVAYMVTAAASGLTTVNFSLTNTTGSATSMTANAGTTPQSATVSTAFANPLAVTVKDAGSNPVAGVNVTFTAPGSGASGLFSNSTTSIVVATNAAGVASAPFTANATSGVAYTVTAAASGLTTVNFSLTNTTGSATSMTANAGTTPQSATVSTAFANPLAVTVKDAGSNPVPGVNVTFTAPGSGASGLFSNSTTSIVVATNAAGVASAPFTANATAGVAYTVTAASTGLTTVNFSLTNTTGSATSITANAGTTPQSATVSTAFANPLAVTVKDVGSNPVAGVNVTFTAPGSGASGLFSNSTTSIVVATNAAGVASAPFTANATAGVAYTVTAAATGLTTVNFSLTNTTGSATSMTANAGTTPQSATVSTAFANPLAVTVKDAGSNPVAGVNVTFTAPGSGASGLFSNSTTSIVVATNAAGVASAPFTANATAGGPYTVTAASTGLTTLDFVLTNTSTSTVVTNVTSTNANGTYGVSAALGITITFSRTVTVTGTPLLTLNSGGTAAYSSGSGTATLTFTYTVGAGQNSAHLDATSTGSLTLSGGTITDSASQAAVLTLPAPGAAGSLGANKTIVIDTVAPTVTSLSSTSANGTYGVGAVLGITVTVSKTVTVTGTPLLALNSGGTAAYSSGSGGSTLTFTYTVGAGQNSAHLDATSTGSLTLSGGTITGSGSQAAGLMLPTPGAAGSLGANKTIVIDTAAPAVVSYQVLWGSQSYNVIGTSRNRLPWQISAISVVFSKPIASGNINSLTGVSATGLSGLGTNTLTWTISPLAIGNFATTLAGSGPNALSDAASNGLAGGAGFSQALKILYGDFNDDGVVGAPDFVSVNNAISAPYNIFADMNGDGIVNLSDVQIVRTRNGTSLP